MSKQPQADSYRGWNLSTSGTTIAPRVSILDNTGTEVFTAGTTFTAGTNTLIGAQIDRYGQRMRTITNSLNSSSAAINRVGHMTRPNRMRIGSVSEGAPFQDFEWRMAAIWRRPLTQREVTVLANSNAWGS